jgi:hypothetical protein
MPVIPTSDPYVSTAVAHTAPKQAVELDIHMADPLYKERVQQLRNMESTAKDAIGFVLKLNETYMDERQKDIDFQSIMDYRVVDAQKEVEFQKALASEQDPDRYDGMYKEFHKDRVNRANFYAGSVSRGAWAKLQQDVLGRYSEEYPRVAISAIKKRREQSRGRLGVTLNGIVNDPDMDAATKIESMQGTLELAKEEGVIDAVEADELRQKHFRETAVNENLKDAEARASLFSDEKEMGSFIFDRYLTEDDRRGIKNARSQALNRWERAEAQKLNENGDWAEFDAANTPTLSFQSPEEARIHYANAGKQIADAEAIKIFNFTQSRDDATRVQLAREGREAMSAEKEALRLERNQPAYLEKVKSAIMALPEDATLEQRKAIFDSLPLVEENMKSDLLKTMNQKMAGAEKQKMPAAQAELWRRAQKRLSELRDATLDPQSLPFHKAGELESSWHFGLPVPFVGGKRWDAWGIGRERVPKGGKDYAKERDKRYWDSYYAIRQMLIDGKSQKEVDDAVKSIETGEYRDWAMRKAESNDRGQLRPEDIFAAMPEEMRRLLMEEDEAVAAEE